MYKGDVARMTLSLPRPWTVRAGERISLGIPYVGIFYLFQSHPFTITWWESDSKGRAVSISVLFRPRSGFTRKAIERIVPEQECGAWIDGPFGPSSVHTIGWSGTVGDYGHVFMVATGIGIAAQLPYLKELLDGHDNAQVRTQKISLVWQVDREGDWESARDWLQSLVAQDNGYMLHVTVYDQMQPQSEIPVRHIGKNNLINIYGGTVDWEEQLDSEVKNQLGSLLVIVSAQYHIQQKMRQLVRARVYHGIEVFEQEFQPWSETGSLRAFLTP
ncbi:hypothetical protein N7516_008922 [Penicillium verrucosum]|uniref:uncharacterized protein n=1 Tax=Penicillium verrucosum TaxID=60171 RepID=UPI0025450689|nr:uncharacterized protein N7516_008922 [Penicillium verrucosum]KAJ5927149.1 hypothetical protein N7516_008922 [Penicillium verrucosum]